MSVINPADLLKQFLTKITEVAKDYNRCTEAKDWQTASYYMARLSSFRELLESAGIDLILHYGPEEEEKGIPLTLDYVSLEMFDDDKGHTYRLGRTRLL